MLEQLGKTYFFDQVKFYIHVNEENIFSALPVGFYFAINFNYYLDMRRDVQEIFRSTPHEKQVCMFSATLSKDIRPVCKKFMQDVREKVEASPG